MAPVAASVANVRDCALQRTRPLRELDRACTHALMATVVRREAGDGVAPLLQLAGTLIGVELATEDVVRRVLAYHPDTLWAFTRHRRLVGGAAMLMLNAIGLEALLAGTLNHRDPPMSCLASPGIKPAGIYLWAFCESSGSDGVLNVLARLQSPLYASSDIYALPVTSCGLGFLQRWGFQPVVGHPRNLFQYIRLANRSH